MRKKRRSYAALFLMKGELFVGFVPEPKQRSALRLRLGAAYYRARRWGLWLFGGTQFAKVRPELSCPHLCAAHKTPLFRPLKDLEQRLQENKVVNLRLAAARLDGAVLLPGESLSYWRRVGNPTKGKGHLGGMVLCNGKVVPGIGGGLCQLANLLYWMTLHTSLAVTERWHHGYDVFPDCNRTQPFGSGATCYYNYMDLVVHNNTDAPWRLHVHVTDTHLVGEWRAAEPQALRYEVYEAAHEMRGEYWGGYTRHNTLRRRVLDGGGTQVGDELVCENHAVMMYSPLLPEGNV